MAIPPIEWPISTTGPTGAAVAIMLPQIGGQVLHRGVVFRRAGGLAVRALVVEDQPGRRLSRPAGAACRRVGGLAEAGSGQPEPLVVPGADRSVQPCEKITVIGAVTGPTSSTCSATPSSASTE